MTQERKDQKSADLKSDDGALAAAAMHTLNCHHVIELEDD